MDKTKSEIITREYKVYEFKELAPEVQRKVIDKMAQQELEIDFWYEFELDNISNDLLEEYGIEVKPSEISFDLYRNWLCLGKNADIVDIKKFITNIVDNKVLLAQIISNPDWNLKDVYLNLFYNDRRETNYIGVSCNGYIYEDGDPRWGEDTCKTILEQELQINLDECISKINKDMLKRLRDEQDYIQSDEHIKEEIKERELKFLENGDVF
jgi:hypothetical protein